MFLFSLSKKAFRSTKRLLSTTQLDGKAVKEWKWPLDLSTTASITTFLSFIVGGSYFLASLDKEIKMVTKEMREPTSALAHIPPKHF